MGKRADKRFMGRAIALARLNYGMTGKNPSVGCVIVDRFGHVVGEGITAPGGRPHAEQIALDMAGDRARGATAYVTLEPCQERSTGEDSCSKRFVDAGVARVVCPIADKHPQGAGGFDVLRAGGVEVLVGIKKDQAESLYKGFFAQQK